MNTLSHYPTLDQTQFSSIVHMENTILIDARPTAAYIGWAYDGLSRGGHIPGATDFSRDWIDADNSPETHSTLEQRIEEKNLRDYSQIILYDTNGKDAVITADFLHDCGLTSLFLFDARPWFDSNSCPLEKYPNYQNLVPAFVLKARMDGAIPETFSSSRPLKLFEVSWGESKDTSYASGHIPGAVHINSDWFESPDTDWMLNSDDDLYALVAKLGIEKNDCVIMAGEEMSPLCRFAVILNYLGIKDARVLSAGLGDWAHMGYAFSTEETFPTPTASIKDQCTKDDSWIVTIPQLKERLKDPAFTLVDTRTWAEYIGEDTGYDYHKYAGRIEGAVFAYSGDNHDSSPYRFRNPDGTIRNDREILKMWTDAGIDIHNHLSFMCGGGWRAAEILWYAKTIGLENASLYSDGWCGWSNKHLPSIKGTPT